MILNNRYRGILTLAIPVIISQVGQVLVGFVDTLMVAQLGTAEPLAGVAFTNALYNPFLVGGMGLAMGLTPLVSNAQVRGNNSRIHSLLKNSAVLNTVIAVAFTAIFSLLILLMPYMGQDPVALQTATPYGWLMALSILPTMWMYTLRQFLEGLGNTMWAMVVTITANLLNVGMNFLFIYGMWGFPEMGAVGAGLATAISRVLMFLLMFYTVYKVPKFRVYLAGFRRELILRFRLIRLWRTGYPISLQLGVETTGFGIMAIVIGTFSATALSGHQIAVNLPTLAFMVVTGVANATMIITARNYALKLYSEVRATLNASLRIITVFMTLTAICFVIFAIDIAAIFTPDPEIQAVTAHLLIFASIFQISDGIQGVALGALRGMLDVKRPMYYSIISYFAVGVPIGYILAYQFNMEASGVWLGIVSALTLLSILYIRRFRSLIINK